MRLFNLNCFAGASCNDETKANNCNNFAQCASVSVCPAPCAPYPVPRLLLVELFSSATQQQRQPNFGIVVFGVACGNHFRSLPPYGSHPASSSLSFSCSFSPQSLNRQTLPAKCFRRNVPQSCKYKQRCAAQFFENILSFSSGFSPKELHTFLIEQLGNARQSKGWGAGRGWPDGWEWHLKFQI